MSHGNQALTAGSGHSSLDPLVGTVPHTLTSTHRNLPLDFTLASLLGYPEWQNLLHGEFICAPRVLEKWSFLKGCLLADVAKAPGWRNLKMKGFSWTETILRGFS